jgi:hypothetical protein
MNVSMAYDPVIKQVTCSECHKQSSVRVLTQATHVTFHCPHCKKITKASVG